MVDKISNLPDCILSHILSFLPTKNAVATGILSKRWKFIWTMVLDLYFDDVDDVNAISFLDIFKNFELIEERNVKFVQFVNKVLSLRKAETINKFSVVWAHMCDSYNVSDWISIAVANNAQEIIVHAVNWKSWKSMSEIPYGIFNSERLKTLDLKCGINISAAIVVCLPKLEFLKLNPVYFERVEAFQKLLNGCPMLKYLELNCDKGIFILAAIVVCLPRLETLKLALVYFECEEAFQKLIIGCPMLKSLELRCGNDICLSAAVVISLPRLETLKLHSSSFECVEACQCLISGCPVLKYLHISVEIDKDTEGVSNAFTFMVSSPSLIHLELYVSCKDSRRISYCSLELEAPSLQFLKVHDYVSRIFVRVSMSSLVEANFTVLSSARDDEPLEESFSNSIVEAVRGFNCAESLTLSNLVMRALDSARSNLCTRFKRLKKLTVTADCCFWSPLQEFIQCSDILEAVTFNKGYCESQALEKSCWKSLEQVPECLSNSLKLVSFPWFEGCPDEIAMVGYVLKHGSVLQVVDIQCNTGLCSFERDLRILREISEFPRKSPVCALKFH